MRFLTHIALAGALALIVGSVVAPARADLLVGSNKNSRVLRYDEATGDFVGAFITAGSGGLVNPGGMAVGPDGNIYVSSNGTNSILRYTPAGDFAGVFVSGNGLVKPSGLAFGADGNLYVNSHGPSPVTNSSAVLRFDGVTGDPKPAPGQLGAVFVPAGSGGLDQASVGILLDKNGNLYVNSHLTNAVLRFDGVTGAPLPAPGHSGADFVTGGSGGLKQPSGLTFGPDGNLYVGAHFPSAGHGAVFRYDGTTGNFIDMFVEQDSGNLKNPTDLLFGPDGLLYVDSRATSSVLRYNGTTGAFVDTFVSQGSGGLNAPNSLLFFNVVPEPHPLSLLAVGMIAVSVYARRRRSCKE